MLTDAELLQAYVIGRSPDALAELWSRYAALVRDNCRRHLGETLWVDDAAQEVLRLLAEDAASINGQHLEAWLRKTARNVCANWHRGEARRHRHEVACGLDAQNVRRLVTDVQRPSSDAGIALETALEKLDEKQRRSIGLRHLEGRDIEDGAREMGASKHAVDYYWWRGLQRLRELLKNARITFPLLIPWPFRLRFRRAGMFAPPKVLVAAAIAIATAGATGVVIHRSNRFTAPPPPPTAPSPPYVVAPAPLSPLAPPPELLADPERIRAGLRTHGEWVSQIIEGMNYLSNRPGDMRIEADWKSLANIGITRHNLVNVTLEQGTLMTQVNQFIKQIAPSGTLRAVVRGDHIVIECNPDFGFANHWR